MSRRAAQFRVGVVGRRACEVGPGCRSCGLSVAAASHAGRGGGGARAVGAARYDTVDLLHAFAPHSLSLIHISEPTRPEPI
eukprot:8883506-Pyramimonas_sp.AAC.1